MKVKAEELTEVKMFLDWLRNQSGYVIMETSKGPWGTEYVHPTEKRMSEILAEYQRSNVGLGSLCE